MINKTVFSKRRKKNIAFFFLLFIFGACLFLYNGYWFIKGYSLGNSVTDIDIKSDLSLTQMESRTLLKKNIPLYPKRPEVGESYGVLEIPLLDETLPIYYGVESEQLKKGIGQVNRTALPGEGNNTILSGHRDTVLRNLGKLEVGDQLIASTAAGMFTYRITKINIVDKDDLTVISPKPRDTLTLITCYPFYFIGPAPQRYVISAELISSLRK